MSSQLTANSDPGLALALAVHHPSSTTHHPSLLPPLRVAAFEPRSLVNGPGVRAVLWVQGCGRRCPGCFNPEFLPREGGRIVPLEEVIRWIRDAAVATNHPSSTIHHPSSSNPQPSTTLEGVTFSGGEPFDQAASLACVACAMRELGLGILVFTGHPWEELQRSTNAGHLALLAEADLLAAGPYDRDAIIPHPSTHPSTHPSIHQSNDPPIHHPLLASANQRLVFLTDRYRHWDFGTRRRVEFRIAPDGTVRTTGFPPHSSTYPAIH